MEDAAAPDAQCPGNVIDVEFGGAVCTVTLALANVAGVSPLTIKSSSVGLPEIGSTVHVSVLGKAHVFDAVG